MEGSVSFYPVLLLVLGFISDRTIGGGGGMRQLFKLYYDLLKM